MQQGRKKALSELKSEACRQNDWNEMQTQFVSALRMCLSDEITHQVMDITASKQSGIN